MRLIQGFMSVSDYFVGGYGYLLISVSEILWIIEECIIISIIEH